MRFRIIPRDTTFFDLFASAGDLLVASADTLAQLIGAPSNDRATLAAELKDIEHQADGVTHQLLKRLNQTFVTPFDRDDIYELAAAIDDCVDHIEAAGKTIVLYQVTELLPDVVRQAALLQRAAEVTVSALAYLPTLDPQIESTWIEANRIENEADEVYAQVLEHLFSNPYYQETPSGVVSLLKLKTVIDTLEKAADSFETVAQVIETIVRKES